MTLIQQFYSDLKKYKDYVFYAVKSELKEEFAGSFFGYIWWVLDPLMYMLIYMLLVMVIFQRGDKDFPIFVFCALIPWKWSISVIMNSIDSIKSKSSILHQVYIPKFIFPLIRVIIQTVKFLFGMIVLLVMIKFFKIPFSLYNLGFIPVFITQFLFLFACSLYISHIGVYFKDIKNIANFSTRLWFYLSTGLYSLSRVPENFRSLWLINPITVFFESYRNAFLYGELPMLIPLLIWFCVSIISIVIGLSYLSKYDKKYVKVI